MSRDERKRFKRTLYNIFNDMDDYHNIVGFDLNDDLYAIDYSYHVYGSDLHSDSDSDVPPIED